MNMGHQYHHTRRRSVKLPDIFESCANPEHTHAIRFHITNDISLLDSTNDDSETPIFVAVQHNNERAIFLLAEFLEKRHIDHRSRFLGWSVLHYAACLTNNIEFLLAAV